ncbi:serine/threonine-protein kinase pakF isoform X2 [Contarinia nasturtii]|uniref:serine/threonine-protein kinase pakF isoform X2 n=1 Tax=Contarinia nasturtii TaxID=265458 RepID=UPI0012D39F9B|nr:serine/threonine-protein kinase pakF isoform X2 [Contarinia nasturtii]
MDSITTTNTISLNCDIELTNKVLSLHAKHFTRPHENHSKYELISKSCQDRINAVVNIAIDLISYLINLCASFGWQSAHTIYCVKFIRLNQRALLHHLKSIRLVEHIKSIGIDLIKNAQWILYPIVYMMRRKSHFDGEIDNGDDNDGDSDNCENASNATKYHSNNSSTNNNSHNRSNDTNNNSDSNKTITQNDDDADEIDNVSLEILWEPKCGSQITADVVFIHGLHGSSDSTWKQGEWDYKPQTANDNFIQITHHEQHNDSSKHQHDTHHHIQTDDNTTNATNNNHFNSATLESLSQCWPKDWLPIDFPTARVSAINYDTDPHLWRPIWYPSRKRSSLAIRAMKMIRILVEHKIGVNRPIIWVGHSKGGLYIKQIIVNAHECNAYWLWKSSSAVLFYSVPHRGSPLAELNLPLLTRSIEMIEIQKIFPQ